MDRSVRVLLGFLVVALALDLGMRASGERPAFAQTDPAAAARERRRDATVRAVEKAGPAVANIATERVVVERFPPGFEEFFRAFGGGGSERRSVAKSLGSGVIVDPQGYIVTNAHVVQRASKIVVTLPDNRELAAELLSLSYVHDLALLKVDAGAPLPAIKLGTSGDLMMGETVIALGNPFGLENTVTRGVISAKDRRIKKDGRDVEGTFLQTDAAINPGNSGGPLINIDAELVGVNTAIHAGGQGIGFAIPVDRVRTVLAELSDPDLLSEQWTGLVLEDGKEGVRVARVDEGSPAAAASVRAGDLVEAAGAGSAPATSVFDVHKQCLGAATVQLQLRSADGTRRAVSIVPAKSPVRATVERRIGVEVHDLTPALAWKQGLDIDAGILVASVIKGGPASRVGVEAGDVITKIGRKVVDQRLGQNALEVTRLSSTSELARALEKVAKGDEIGIFVLRKGRELQGELHVD